MINKKDRIEAAIRHIQTSVDIDPWAMELAVEALKEKADLQPDCISRQTLQKELALYPIDDVTSEDEAGYNRAINDIQKMVLHLPSAQPERTCVNCGRTANNGGWYADGRTRCPIEEHYALPKDGYCHLWEKKKVWEDDYVKRPEEGEK